MLRTRDEILARLAALGIETRTYDHPPVFTVEESRQHTRHIPGAHCKNLFLKDKKGSLWLVTCADERRVDLNALSKRLGAARFSFGRPELLREVLGVEPGSVTPLAIVNDADRRVTHVLDEAWLGSGLVNCHPLQNDATTVLASADLLRFIRSTGHEPMIVDLDEG
jgi:Ala-tRNA(Pro) deacylase